MGCYAMKVQEEEYLAIVVVMMGKSFDMMV